MRILTQHPVEIALSTPAMRYILDEVDKHCTSIVNESVFCEVENFINLLHNLIERSEPSIINNEDLL